MFSRINRAFAKSRAEDGFTLIELLIVIVIIGILAAIAIPIFLNQQNAAHDASVKSDARNTVIGVASALVTKPDATGFSVLAPGDTTAAVKLAGVPSVIVTVPTGAVAVRGVATQSNWVTVRGTGAGYVVHAQSTVDGFWYEFKSKTGKYTSSSDTPVVTPAVPSSKTPVPNSVQNPNGIAMRVDGAPVTTTDGTGGGGTGNPAGTYGMALADFPTTPPDMTDPTSGWNMRDFVSDGDSRTYNSSPSGNKWSSPVLYSIGGLYNYQGAQNIVSTIYHSTVADDRGSNYYQNFSDIQYGPEDSYVTCANLEYSKTNFVIQGAGGSGGDFNASYPDAYTHSPGLVFSIANYSCLYIQSFTIKIHYYTYPSIFPQYYTFTWNAADFKAGKQLPLKDAKQTICAAAADDVALTLRGCQ